jgi:hypothetical protein
MRKFGRIVLSFIFWSYERGSIQYDIAVVLIVVFVLASPRYWFHDRPQELTPKLAGVALISMDAASGARTYRVDTRVLAYPLPEPELEHLIHDAIHKNAPELEGKQFHIVGMRPVFNDSGDVVSYEVSIQP